MRSLIFAASLLLPAPGFATEWVYCGDSAEDVSVGMLLGGADFASISAVTLMAGTDAWSSAEVYGPGKPIAVAQSFFGDSQVMVDFTEDESGGLIAELRLFTAEEGEYYARGGILRVAGHGAWVVSCEGP